MWELFRFGTLYFGILQNALSANPDWPAALLLMRPRAFKQAAQLAHRE